MSNRPLASKMNLKANQHVADAMDRARGNAFLAMRILADQLALADHYLDIMPKVDGEIMKIESKGVEIAGEDLAGIVEKLNDIRQCLFDYDLDRRAK